MNSMKDFLRYFWWSFFCLHHIISWGWKATYISRGEGEDDEKGSLDIYMQLVPKAIICMLSSSRVSLQFQWYCGCLTRFWVSFRHGCKGQFINHTRFLHLFVYICSFLKINSIIYLTFYFIANDVWVFKKDKLGREKGDWGKTEEI